MSDPRTEPGVASEAGGPGRSQVEGVRDRNSLRDFPRSTVMVPTVDGVRVEFDQINVGTSAAASDRWFSRLRRGLSLFLAGMYTGVKCGGIPHSHHTYRSDRDKGPL